MYYQRYGEFCAAGVHDRRDEIKIKADREVGIGSLGGLPGICSARHIDRYSPVDMAVCWRQLAAGRWNLGSRGRSDGFSCCPSKETRRLIWLLFLSFDNNLSDGVF